MEHLRIEDLPGELPGLLEDRTAVLRVGEAVEIGALVDEAPAVGVDENAEGIAVLLELVADGELAELGRVPVPAAGVAARPVTEGAGADLEGHAEAIAGVEARAAHLGQLPARTKVARPPLGVGLEAAAGEHDRPRGEITKRSAASYPHAVHAHTVPQERQGPRLEEDLDPTPAGRRRQGLDEPGAAAGGFDGKAAEEFPSSPNLAGLAPVDRHEARPLATEPDHGVEASRDEQLDEGWIGAVLGEAEEVVEVLRARVGAEVGAGDLLFGEIGDLPEVVDPVEGEAHDAAGEPAVAARLRFRGALEDDHAGAVLARGQGGTERGVAGSHHDDVVLRAIHRA